MHILQIGRLTLIALASSLSEKEEIKMLKNLYLLSKTTTTFLWEEFNESTKGIYKVTDIREYSDKKGILPDGYFLELEIIQDDKDYGFSKDGKKRGNNLYSRFNCHVLTRKEKPILGQNIRLFKYDEDNSYVFDVLKGEVLLRFRDFEIVKGDGK